MDSMHIPLLVVHVIGTALLLGAGGPCLHSAVTLSQTWYAELSGLYGLNYRPAVDLTCCGRQALHPLMFVPSWSITALPVTNKILRVHMASRSAPCAVSSA